MSAKRQKVVVAMSGGVDSSVAAALLVDQGYDVTGMMLRLWSEPGKETYNRCCTPAAMASAKEIASTLNIPFYTIDAKTPFREIVVNYYLEGYSKGITPNPCFMCNRHIRWEYLLNRALSLGAEFMATGHYARVERSNGKPIRLLKGLDVNKDQSYVLSVLNQEQLKHALFPVGEYTKAEVRNLAEKYDLPSAQVKDSQDLCFLAGTDNFTFLKNHAPQTNNPGPIINKNNKVIGEHQGLAFHTIGQRKGLGIAHPTPLYVIEKDIINNTLVVGEKSELGSNELNGGNANWLNGSVPQGSLEAQIKIRSTSAQQPGTVTPLGEDRFKVIFEYPLRDITPGQAAVIYQNNEVIGSGIIEGDQVRTKEFVPLNLIGTAT